jgi:hypothetical protein
MFRVGLLVGQSAFMFVWNSNAELLTVDTEERRVGKRIFIVWMSDVFGWVFALACSLVSVGFSCGVCFVPELPK